MWRVSVLALCLLAAPLPRLVGQWSVAVEAGMAGFAGGSTDTAAATDPGSFRPYYPATVLVRLDRRWSRIGVGIGLLYCSAGVAEESSEFAVVAKDLLELYEIAPEASVLVAKPGPGGALRVHVGPVLDLWFPKGDSRRTRPGGHATISLEWALGGRLTGALRAGLALTGSAFDEGELPSRFERRAMWRRSLSGGVRVRL